MRTKTLLLTAALSAAGIVTSFAQGSVYSVNVVGYINLDLPAGYSMIANQLDNGKGNKLADVIPAAPEGSFFFKFNGVAYDQSGFADGVWDDQGSIITLAPGEGGFMLMAAPGTLTLVGEVLQSPNTNGPPLVVPVVAGYSVISSKVPQAGLLETDLKFDPTGLDGMFVFKFDPATGAYLTYSWADGSWDEQPSIAVGESFFMNSPAAKNWSRIFVVQ